MKFLFIAAILLLSEPALAQEIVPVQRQQTENVEQRVSFVDRALNMTDNVPIENTTPLNISPDFQQSRLSDWNDHLGAFGSVSANTEVRTSCALRLNRKTALRCRVRM